MRAGPVGFLPDRSPVTVATESFELVASVEPEIVRLMDEHRERRQHWYAHDVVPWEMGRSFRDEPWDESQATLSPEVRTALQLNLLTEDNLPYYHAKIAGSFRRGIADEPSGPACGPLRRVSIPSPSATTCWPPGTVIRPNWRTSGWLRSPRVGPTTHRVRSRCSPTRRPRNWLLASATATPA